MGRLFGKQKGREQYEELTGSWKWKENKAQVNVSPLVQQDKTKVSRSHAFLTYNMDAINQAHKRNYYRLGHKGFQRG